MKMECKTCRHCNGEWVEEINDLRPYCIYTDKAVDLDDVCDYWTLRKGDFKITPTSSLEEKIKHLIEAHPDTKKTLNMLFPHLVHETNLEKLHSSELVQERVRHYVMQILRELGRESEVSKVEEIAELLRK